ALHDNPKLTARNWTGRNPVRIVIDPKLNLDPSLHLFDGTTPTICYNNVRQDIKDNVEYHLLEKEHLLDDMLANLFDRNIQSLIATRVRSVIYFSGIDELSRSTPGLPSVPGAARLMAVGFSDHLLLQIDREECDQLIIIPESST